MGRQQLALVHDAELQSQRALVQHPVRTRPGVDFTMKGLVGRSAAQQECSLEGSHGMPDPEVVEQPLDSIQCCCLPQHFRHFFVGACDLARDFIGEAATHRNQGHNEVFLGHSGMLASRFTRIRFALACPMLPCKISSRALSSSRVTGLWEAPVDHTAV